MKTLYDNIFNNHIIEKYDDLYLLYIDKILLHEVTSPQAFYSLGEKKIWKKNSIFSTSDHNVSTDIKERFFINDIKQINYIKKSCEKFFFNYKNLNSYFQGIIHIIAAESRIILPGMIIICGDSHTTTNGALSLIASGIGTTDLELALSTQCLIQKKLKNMKIKIENIIKNNLTSKDLILYIIKKISSKGGMNYCIEFSGNCIKNFSISERMTICNMSIEAGSKISLISPDEKIIEFYEKKIKNINNFIDYLNIIKTKKNAHFDKKYIFDSKNINPMITWGTNLDTIINLEDKIDSNDFEMLNYMGINNGDKMIGKKVDKIFIGSCTNSRFEDLLICSIILLKCNKKIDKFIKAYVVPGSEQIRLKAEYYSIDKIFKKFGFIWKSSGCSMCLGMNKDKLLPKERCVSTSNRNFVGRQGYKGRTHLTNPILATIISIYGVFIDYNKYNEITNDINFNKDIY